MTMTYKICVFMRYFAADENVTRMQENVVFLGRHRETLI